MAMHTVQLALVESPVKYVCPAGLLKTAKDKPTCTESSKGPDPLL